MSWNKTKETDAPRILYHFRSTLLLWLRFSIASWKCSCKSGAPRSSELSSSFSSSFSTPVPLWQHEHHAVNEVWPYGFMMQTPGFGRNVTYEKVIPCMIILSLPRTLKSVLSQRRWVKKKLWLDAPLIKLIQIGRGLMSHCDVRAGHDRYQKQDNGCSINICIRFLLSKLNRDQAKVRTHY